MMIGHSSLAEQLGMTSESDEVLCKDVGFEAAFEDGSMISLQSWFDWDPATGLPPNYWLAHRKLSY